MTAMVDPDCVAFQFGDVRLPQRFWDKARVDESGCWIWIACIEGHGYGRFRVGRKVPRAHQVIYEALVAPVPEGLCLDHLCRVRPCVNPAHLEVVTLRENTQRGNSGLPQRSRTHCPAGHPYDDENTYLNAEGERNCKECNRARARAYQRARAAKRKATV